MVEAQRFKVLVLNQISANGLKRLPTERYATGKDLAVPDAVLVRSADMHAMDIPASVRAIGRAGAGTNNIPVKAMSARGVPVFNAPGANANAVKELVLAGMLMAARNLGGALRFVDALDTECADLDKAVEDGKKAFAGFELAGHTLGIVGLGKVGCLVADAAIKLGMNVLGYDPDITVDAAWSLPSQVRRAASSIAASTSSLTALAFAPGALNTGTPRALIALTGMLLVPAPARPMARTLAGIGIACMSAERTSTASGTAKSLPVA